MKVPNQNSDDFAHYTVYYRVFAAPKVYTHTLSTSQQSQHPSNHQFSNDFEQFVSGKDTVPVSWI